MLSLHFLLTCDFTQTDVPFNPTTLEELPPRPLCLASFIAEHFELVLFHVELNLCDDFIDFDGWGQGLSAEWVDAAALRTPSNIEKHYDMLQKSQTYTTPWYGCFVGPAVALLQCPSLKARVAEVVAAQAKFSNGLVGTEGVGEGLGIKKAEKILWGQGGACLSSSICSCEARGGRAFTPSSPKLLPSRSTSLTVWLICKASARACRVGQVDNTGTSACQDFHSRYSACLITFG